MHPTTKSPSEMAYCIVGKRRRNLKRSLEKAKQSKKKSLERVGWWQFPTNPNCYTLTITPSRVRSVVWG